VTKLMVRAALAAALALGGGAMTAGGELDRGDAPAIKATPTPRGRESKIRVYLPTAEARLYVDGTLTSETGLDRLFRAQGLDQNKRYVYRLLAVWVENGREVTHETKIVFWGGDDLSVSFRR
jgi:uncharacterized protein (TIGR03000 family)